MSETAGSPEVSSRPLIFSFNKTHKYFYVGLPAETTSVMYVEMAV